MAISDPTTTVLGLPLKATGHVALAKSFKRAMTLIDSAIAALQGGTGIDATEITYTADDSNSTQAERSVAAELDALRARLTRVEGRVDSNSQG